MPSETELDRIVDGPGEHSPLDLIDRPKPGVERGITEVGSTIEVSNLDIYYGAFHAVADVNMTIQPNAATALIGSSGCGKSTFLRAINACTSSPPPRVPRARS